MKPLKILGIIVCLLLVLSVARCTDSNKSPPETAPIENTLITNQPTPDDTVSVTTDGSTDSVIRENTTVSSPKKLVIPIVNLSANVTSGYAPLSILFTFSSQNATVTGWDLVKDQGIDYEDGLFNSAKGNLVHEFQDPGNYTFILLASNENETVSKQVTINVR